MQGIKKLYTADDTRGGHFREGMINRGGNTGIFSSSDLENQGTIFYLSSGLTKGKGDSLKNKWRQFFGRERTNS